MNPYESPMAVTEKPSRLIVIAWRLAAFAMFSVCPILMTFHAHHELGVDWRLALAAGLAGIVFEVFGAGAAVLFMQSIAVEVTTETNPDGTPE